MQASGRYLQGRKNIYLLKVGILFFCRGFSRAMHDWGHLLKCVLRLSCKIARLLNFEQ
jgi:hypothetical protein